MFAYLLLQSFRAQEPCESRGGHPGLPVLLSLVVSVDVKQHSDAATELRWGVGGEEHNETISRLLSIRFFTSVLLEDFAGKHEEFRASETLSLLILQKPLRAQHF